MKAIIFDMDGVLVDSMKYHIEAWHEAFVKHNLKITTKEIALLEGMPYHKTIDLISERNNKIISEEEKYDIYLTKEKIFDKIMHFEIYEGVVDFIKKLKKQNLKLAVVTGSRRYFATKILEENFDNLFDVLITTDDIKHGKPSPEPYDKAIKLLEVDKEDALVIENAPLGIQSAKAANLKVIAIETTLDKENLSEADHVLKNHKELFDFVNTKAYQ
jgi:beta-phosphoglucomutase